MLLDSLIFTSAHYTIRRHLTFDIAKSVTDSIVGSRLGSLLQSALRHLNVTSAQPRPARVVTQAPLRSSFMEFRRKLH